MKTLHRLFSSLCLFAMALSVSNAGPSDEPILTDSPPASYQPANPWSFDFALYGWLIGLDGSATVNGVTAEIDKDFSDIWEDLDFSIQALGHLRYRQWGLLADLSYLSLSSDVDPPGQLLTRAEIDSTTYLLNLLGTYRIAEGGGSFVDLGAGARWLRMEVDVSLESGLFPPIKQSSKSDLWDGIFALRARYQFENQIFLTGYGDVGTGQTDLSWQISGLIGYQFTERVFLSAGYRYLSIEGSSDNTDIDLVIEGPVLALGFQF